ncbi:MAG: isoprenoid biosynthesis glyoxalase ElbB [Rhodospirillaceae bacterium]|jgi:enhancing lycopene biosynthesis protein 2|nr:isoprenoid biosynthesis glyoxalase ElbB [Rhodospirillaceae bacterium]MBT5245667.1 isoprenoid biosynthesis glyoxalase ElbB [Rhodospirillaceae bacterium]MBT5561234.1 isoprenoid biosynthesis glyoxalase ElbB [Rhodospirillaceae bacterium]MBT6240527.1 isoprenoid biosynthesis glyoxalase ElbB [Rhodospirillaceae bacterium]MBT7136606.1 isoprenoid biosynthesis glyoxalase ElbB [Rhodospirillaceae bacterium]
MTDTKPTIAVVLSGCGVYDGAEIHESTLTLLALDRQGAAYQCFAPDVEQAHVVNHLNGEVSDESRNVLVESARIARGAIKDVKEFDAADFDAIIFPGGFGAAKNLCSFAFDGADCTVNDDVRAVVKAVHGAGKPIGALCIAPAMIARVLEGAEVTIGQDPDTAEAIQAMGGAHKTTTHGEIVIDEALRLVTSPCYMLDATISQIADGADNTVRSVLDMVKQDRKAA